MSVLSFAARAEQTINCFQDKLLATPLVVPCRTKLQKPLPVSESPYVFVESEIRLRKMIDDLCEVDEFSVDVEYKQRQDFSPGHVCTVQLSTRSSDYLVDAIRCRRWMFLLRPYFLRPTTLKVFHGANMDLRWLRNHFGIYVCNLFDTSIAMAKLGYTHPNLANLLASFCEVRTDKNVSRLDWATRPLPTFMVEYARTDVHYLSYCKDRLLCDLLERKISLGPFHENSLNQIDFIHSVRLASHKLCLKSYAMT